MNTEWRVLDFFFSTKNKFLISETKVELLENFLSERRKKTFRTMNLENL